MQRTQAQTMIDAVADRVAFVCADENLLVVMAALILVLHDAAHEGAERLRVVMPDRWRDALTVLRDQVDAMVVALDDGVATGVVALRATDSARLG